MNAIKSKMGAFATLAVVLMLAVSFAPMIISDESDAANPSTTINIQPGQTWSWTPTFTSGLSPTVTVSGSESAMPADTASFSTVSGNVSVSGGKVTVSIPSDYSKSVYYVKVKAQTTQPTQTVYYEITFNVATFALNYNVTSLVAKVGEAISDITPTISGGVTAKSYSITGTLPTGLSFNTSTGKITGTPTAYKAQTSYTITATLNTVPVQTVSKTISIGAFTDISASNYTVYTIVGSTNMNVPAVNVPTGTVLESMTSLTVTKDGASGTISAGAAYNGMTVTAKTGEIKGIPTVAGTYVFTETWKATAATGGSTATRTVTVIAEDPVLVSSQTANSYAGHSDTSGSVRSGGLAASSVTYSITGITKNGSAFTNPTSNGFTVGADGKVTCGTAIGAGSYVVTVKAVTKNTTVANSTCGTPAASTNSKTATVTFTVAEAISINNASALNFYMAENKVYDALQLGSNISGATFSVESYGTGVTSSNISVAGNGTVTPGTTALSAGSYTVTVKVTDPANSTNTATATLNINVVGALAYTNAPTIGVIGE